MPIELGSDEQIDQQGIRAVAVNELAVFPVVFHAGPDAAPETLLRPGIDPVVLRADRSEIDVAGMLRVDGSQDMVVEGPLVKVRITGIPGPGE